MPKRSLSSSLFAPSTVMLLVANLTTMYIAVTQHWPISDVVWLFLLQSIIIGFFQGKKILDVKHFSTKGMLLNGKAIPENEQGKISLVTFFAMHYGIFHVVYTIFLLVGYGLPSWSVLGFALLFLINHFFSYQRNRATDAEKHRNIGNMMLFPYARILPMHLIIIFGLSVGATGSLILFLSLKTMADVVMHVVEHRQKSKNS